MGQEERKIEIVRESPLARKEQGAAADSLEDLKQRLADVIERRERLGDKPENIDIVNHLFREEQILREEIKKLEEGK